MSPRMSEGFCQDARRILRARGSGMRAVVTGEGRGRAGRIPDKVVNGAGDVLRAILNGCKSRFQDASQLF